jgi:hypothetical protein
MPDVFDWMPESWEEIPGMEIPEASYKAITGDVKFLLSKAHKSPMVAIPFQIVGGDYDGRLITRNYTLTQKAMRFFKAAVTTLGVDGNDVLVHLKSAYQQLGDSEFVMLPILSNRECVITVGTRKDQNGNDWPDVTGVLPPA